MVAEKCVVEIELLQLYGKPCLGLHQQFNIVDGSTLRQSFELKIVLTFSEEEFTIYVAPSDTVSDIKSIVQEKRGIPSYQQELTYNGNVLEDGFALSHYGVGNGIDHNYDSSVDLKIKVPELMSINIKISTSKTVTLNVTFDEFQYVSVQFIVSDL